MTLLARDIMERNVVSVEPDMPLPELERKFLNERMSGFPVLDNGRLAGIVSRSDIIRQLCVERTVAEYTSDYYHDQTGFHEIPMDDWDQVADRVGERIESMEVKDVMIRKLHVAPPDQPVRSLAQEMVNHRIHRILITQDNELLGIVTALGLVDLIAQNRIHD